MNISVLDDYGKKTYAQIFTQPLRGVLGGRKVTCLNNGSTEVEKIYRIGTRILVAFGLLFIPYTIVAGLALLYAHWTHKTIVISNSGKSSNQEKFPEDKAAGTKKTQQKNKASSSSSQDNATEVKQNAAAIKIQSQIRSSLAREKMENIKKQNAAIKIQSQIRSSLARKKNSKH